MTRSGLLVRAAGTVFCLWIIVRQADLGATWGHLLGANMVLVGAALLILLARVPLTAYRWQQLLRLRGHVFPVRRLAAVSFVAQAAATLVPGAAGVDLVWGLYLAQDAVPPRHVLETVLADRAVGGLSLVWMAALSAVWLMWHGTHPGVLLPGVIAAAIGVLGAIVCLPGCLARVHARRDPRTTRRTPVTTMLLDVAAVVASRGLLLRLTAASVAFQLAGVASVYLIGLSVGADTAFAGYLICLPVIWLWMMLPISFGGLGVREGAFVYYFGWTGMPSDVALTISLIVFALTLAQAAMASLALVVWRPSARPRPSLL